MKTFVVQYSPGQDGAATRTTPLYDDAGAYHKPKPSLIYRLIEPFSKTCKAAFMPNAPVRDEYYEFQVRRGKPVAGVFVHSDERSESQRKGCSRRKNGFSDERSELQVADVFVHASRTLRVFVHGFSHPALFFCSSRPALASHPLRVYFSFQMFDTLQALCSYLKVQTQTRLVLESLGVGSSAASAVAGATLWTVKDGASHVSGLFFGASYADRWPQYPESFRLLADLSNDVASLLDCALPFLPGLRARVCVTLLCTVSRSLCGVCAGAVRPVILSHLALTERGVADLQAKEGSQETLVTLLGLALGLLLTPGEERRGAKDEAGREERNDEALNSTSTRFAHR